MATLPALPLAGAERAVICPTLQGRNMQKGHPIFFCLKVKAKVHPLAIQWGSTFESSCFGVQGSNPVDLRG